MNRVHEGVHHRGCILLWTLFYVVEAGPSFPGKEKVCLLLLMEKQKNCRILLQLGQYLEENKLCAQPDRSRIKMKEILSKAEYSTTVLHENNILEIVSFMGGGR